MWNHITTAEVTDRVALYLVLAQATTRQVWDISISVDEKQEGVHFNSGMNSEHCLLTRPQKDNFNFACMGPLPQAQQTAEVEVEAAGVVINPFPCNDFR